MDYFQLEQNRGCKFENFNDTKELLTPVCKNCGKQHGIIVAEFDSVEIKESIRIIDFNRDRLMDIISKLLDNSIKRQEKESLPRTIKTIWNEMNEAVKIICAQNDLYQKYEAKK